MNEYGVGSLNEKRKKVVKSISSTNHFNSIIYIRVNLL